MRDFQSQGEERRPVLGELLDKLLRMCVTLQCFMLAGSEGKARVTQEPNGALPGAPIWG